MKNLQQIANRLNEQTPGNVQIVYSPKNRSLIALIPFIADIIYIGWDGESYQTIAKRWNEFCELMSKSKVDITDSNNE